MQRISCGAHIIGMDRVSMTLRALQGRGMLGLIAMDLKLLDKCGASSGPSVPVRAPVQPVHYSAFV